jgi:hypothetical protein
MFFRVVNRSDYVRCRVIFSAFSFIFKMDEILAKIPANVWAIILARVSRRNPASGFLRFLDHASILAFAGASKLTRSRFIEFAVKRSIVAAIDDMTADPAYVFDPCTKTPKLCFVRPPRVSDMSDQGARRTGSWSLVNMNSVAVNVPIGSCATHESFLLSVMAPAATDIELVVHAPNVALGRLVLSQRILSVVLERFNADAEEDPAPVSGSIRGDGVTHCIVSGKVRSLSSLLCICMPRLECLLIGCGIKSLSGVERFVHLRALAIKDPGSCDPATIRRLGSLRSLACIYIGFTCRKVYEKFLCDALPSLSQLESLAVCTPFGSADQFLQNARDAGCSSVLTGIKTMRLLRNRNFVYENVELWTLPGRSPMHTESDVRADLPHAVGLHTLEVYGDWTHKWGSSQYITSITDLRIDSTITPSGAPVRHLSSLGIWNMRHLRALSICELGSITSLGSLGGLGRAITKLEITNCDELVNVGCIATMWSLVSLRVTECGNVRFPSLAGLSLLETLSVDLEHYKRRAEPNLATIPRTLMRLHFNSFNSIAVLSLRERALMASRPEVPRSCELAVLSWDGSWYRE